MHYTLRFNQMILGKWTYDRVNIVHFSETAMRMQMTCLAGS